MYRHSWCLDSLTFSSGAAMTSVVSQKAIGWFVYNLVQTFMSLSGGIVINSMHQKLCEFIQRTDFNNCSYCFFILLKLSVSLCTLLCVSSPPLCFCPLISFHVFCPLCLPTRPPTFSFIDLSFQTAARILAAPAAEALTVMKDLSQNFPTKAR